MKRFFGSKSIARAMAVGVVMATLGWVSTAQAQKTWSNNTSFPNWGDSSAWTPAGVPTAGQTVTFPVAATKVNPNVNVSTAGVILNINDDYTFNASGGTLNTRGGSLATGKSASINSPWVQATSTTFANNGTLTANGNATVTAGIVQAAAGSTTTYAANLTVNGGTVTQVSGTTITFNGNVTQSSGAILGVASGTLDFNGAVSVTGGTLTGASTTTFDGTVSMPSGSGTITSVANASVSFNGASVTLASGNLTGAAGSTITTSATTPLSVTGGTQNLVAATTVTFNGTVSKAGTGTMTGGADTDYNNDVTVSNGTLTSAASATVDFAAGKIVTVSGGTLNAGSSSTVTYNGTVNLTGGGALMAGSNSFLTLNGPVSRAGTGALTGPTGLGLLDVNGDLTVSGGTVTGSPTTTFDGNVSVSGGTVTSAASALVNYAAGKTVTVTGGTVTTGSGANVTYDGDVAVGSTAGTVTTGGGGSTVVYNGSVTITAGGSATSGASSTATYNGTVTNNAGMGNGGLSTFNGSFVNNGSINDGGGRVDIKGPYSGPGTLASQAGGATVSLTAFLDRGFHINNGRVTAIKNLTSSTSTADNSLIIDNGCTGIDTANTPPVVTITGEIKNDSQNQDGYLTVRNGSTLVIANTARIDSDIGSENRRFHIIGELGSTGPGYLAGKVIFESGFDADQGTDIDLASVRLVGPVEWVTRSDLSLPRGFVNLEGITGAFPTPGIGDDAVWHVENAPQDFGPRQIGVQLARGFIHTESDLTTGNLVVGAGKKLIVLGPGKLKLSASHDGTTGARAPLAGNVCVEGTIDLAGNNLTISGTTTGTGQIIDSVGGGTLIANGATQTLPYTPGGTCETHPGEPCCLPVEILCPSTTIPSTTIPSTTITATTSSDGTGDCKAKVNFAPSTMYGCPTPASVTVDCVPASGSLFSKGTTNVTCTATDGAGNQKQCSFDVKVTDDEAPVINSGNACPNQLGLVADCATGKAAYTVPTATDNCDESVTPVCTPASPLAPGGPYTVTCTATDSSNNSSSCNFTVQVVAGLASDPVEWHAPLAGGGSHTTNPGPHTFKPGQSIPVKVHAISCGSTPDGTSNDTSVDAFVEVSFDAGCNGSGLVDITENYSGVGATDGRMVLVDGHWMYVLKTDTVQYPAGTSAPSNPDCFELRVRFERGGVEVGSKSMVLESR